MKTTVDIPESLLTQLKRRAAREGTTLRSLINAALRQFLKDSAKAPGTFKLEDRSAGVGGLAPGVREGDWQQVREIIYEGRGG